MDGILITGVVAVLFWYLAYLARSGTAQQKAVAIGIMILIVGAVGVIAFGPAFFAVIAALVWAAYSYLGWGKQGPPPSR